MEKAQDQPEVMMTPIPGDKLESALDLIARLRATKQKGKVILHLDGSGKIAKIEHTEFVS